MQISDEKVEKYQAIYLEKYGKPIDKSLARDELTSLVCLMEAVRRHCEKNGDKINSLIKINGEKNKEDTKGNS